MSRSIHRTRRELSELTSTSGPGSEQRAQQLVELKKELRKKRRIKHQVRNLRLSRGGPPPTPIEAIPVQEFQASAHNHYPANPEDVRAVLRSLPSGIADGLEAIELRAGVEHQRQAVVRVGNSKCKPDPLTGRQSIETMPGVFTPLVLGCYHPSRNLIYLFSYVYNRGIAHREIIEFYIRLQMLSVFVHEVAHHFDCTSRVARDRWRVDDSSKCEIYAEDVQHDWLAKYVIPYLETCCAEQSAEMQRWLQTHVGTTIPLHLLAGDPRSTTRDGKIFIPSFNTSHAFESLVTAVAEEQSEDKIRTDFARDLHYATEYDVPERILESVLGENPKNTDAIALMADIAEHRGQDSLAVELAERALAIEKNNIQALVVLTFVFRRNSDWQRLLRSARRLYDCSGDIFDIVWAMECGAVVRFHQGQMEKFEVVVAELESLGFSTSDRSAKRLRELADESE